jgi:hypothetical protein
MLRGVGFLIALTAAKASHGRFVNVLLVFAGWIPATIARYVYPPPNRWLQEDQPTSS